MTGSTQIASIATDLGRVGIPQPRLEAGQPVVRSMYGFDSQRGPAQRSNCGCEFVPDLVLALFEVDAFGLRLDDLSVDDVIPECHNESRRVHFLFLNPLDVTYQARACRTVRVVRMNSWMRNLCVFQGLSVYAPRICLLRPGTMTASPTVLGPEQGGDITLPGRVGGLGLRRIRRRLVSFEPRQADGPMWPR